MFSQQELQKVIKETLPPDRTRAIMGVVDKDGVSFVVDMRLKENWTIQAVYKRDWNGQQSGRAQVIWSD